MVYDASLDGDYLDSVIDSVGREFLVDMIPTYEKTSRATLAKLIEAHAEGNGEQVRRLAHQMRSSSTSMGAKEVSAIARELEYLPHDTPVEKIDSAITRISAAFEHALVALAQAIRSEA